VFVISVSSCACRAVALAKAGHVCFVIPSSFDIRASSFLAVASRNNLSSVVVDFRRSISFAFYRLITDSISLTS
jgi:hypothetical protein